MRKLGRCGRKRRKKYSQNTCTGVSQTHLTEFVRLQQWMHSQVAGDTYKSRCRAILEPADFKDTGRGLRATKKIRPGEVIVSIPAQFLITTETVFASEIGSLISLNRQQFTPQELLTIFLMAEQQKGESSFWFPYISTLPEVYSTCLYFSSRELDLLTSPAKMLTMSSKERYKKGFERISNFMRLFVLQHVSEVSEMTVRWAWSTINTRSVYWETPPHPLLINDDNDNHVALAPFLDLLNHKDSVQISAGLNKHSNCYEIMTQDTYKKNQQVFICYGAHDNTKLSIEYGFILPQNLNNCFLFTMNDLKAHFHGKVQHIERKMAIITDAQFNKYMVCNSEGLSWCLIMALRVAALSWDQLSTWQHHIQDINLPKEVDDSAHAMAMQLVKSSLLKAKRHLRLVEMEPELTHYDQLKGLVKDDVLMLENSLASLKNW